LVVPQQAQYFMDLLKRCVGKVLLGVAHLPDGTLVIHLPPAAAIAFEFNQLSGDLEAFMGTGLANYFSGVRRQDPILKSVTHFSKPKGLCRFTFAEIFAGIGGFRLGLEPTGGCCVLASEIDKGAIKTYETNFGGTELVGNIIDNYSDMLPAFDVLTAGFPCQPFTIRGTQEGTNEERGQLYLELVRLLKAHQPKAFLFENVVGLVTMDGGSRSGDSPARANTGGVPNKGRASGAWENNSLAEGLQAANSFTVGRTFKGILAAFGECGYNISWRVVNARHWLPQFRERVYMVGFRNDLGKKMDWNLDGAGKQQTVRAIMEHPTGLCPSYELTPKQWEVMKNQSALKARTPQQHRAIQLDGNAPTLISSYRTPNGGTSKFVFEEADGTIRDGSEGARRPRFLSPRECARVMGFPDSFKIPSIKNAGQNGFYRQIGNAVCPPVIEAIGKNIAAAIAS
jgi:DNA (cytosine-5)-methyltransferase 1